MEAVEGKHSCVYLSELLVPRRKASIFRLDLYLFFFSKSRVCSL